MSPTSFCAIDANTQNAIGKDIDQFPGLTLRPGTHRTYPYNDVACHLLGHLTRVDAENRKDNNKDLDDLHAYLPNDLIGKTGIESLCEPTLRGARGTVDAVQGEETVLARQSPVPGRDVRLSIDIDLQQQIQSVFASARLNDATGRVIEENAVLHGAAIVLDVETNQVLAMVSYPTYDLNQIDELYARLNSDTINEPLRNRATMSAFEPGSTIKPVCGLAAITSGIVGVNEGIECTGAFEENGQLVPHGARCWVASMFGKVLRASNTSVMHHKVPSNAPHVGHDGNPDGFLTFSDALERSCNIYFETSADRLGIDRLSDWYEKFGLGRPTGLGLREAKGRLPRDYPKEITSMRRAMGFLAGMGQGYIAATPIQMANVAATIARNGIWMRPVLVLPDEDNRPPLLHPGAWQTVPDRVNLHLLPEAVKAVKLGMFNVVNGPAGTGKPVAAKNKELLDLLIAAKTGTATAAPFTIPVVDAAGQLVRDETKRVKRKTIEPSYPGKPNPIAPWYRAEVSPITGATSLDHAWFIGFAPMDKPKIAFAVMIEYGGSGGIVAGSVAREAIEACRTRGYVKRPGGLNPKGRRLDLMPRPGSRFTSQLMTESGNPLSPVLRPITARTRWRAWSEPRIRFWLFATLALCAVGLGFIIASLLARAHQHKLITRGVVAQATVVIANGETVKGRPQPPDSVVILEFPWKGEAHSTRPQTLEGRKDFITTNSILPIHVNPDDPDDWTWLDEPLPLITQIIGAIIALPLAAATFLRALLMRNTALQLWKGGTTIDAIVLETRSIAVAPLCRAVRVTPDLNGDDRIYTVYVPPSHSKLARGDSLSIIRPRGGATFAIASAWFE